MAESTLKEKTSKGLFWGGMSNFLQQLLNAAFGIYLARTLSPDDYGLVGMLTIFNMIALLLQDGGFVSALINRKEIRHEDYNSVFWFNVLLAFFCYVVLFFCAPLIAGFFHRSELVGIARWSFLGFLIGSFATAPGALLTKKMMVKEKAIASLTAVSISGIIGVIMAYKGYGYWALVFQTLISWTIVVVLVWYFSGWEPSFSFSIQPIKEMFHFGVRLLTTGLLGIVSSNLLSVFLGRFISAKEVGYYSQANKWGSMGYTSLNAMVNSVAQPVLVEVSDQRERQLRVFRKMIRFAAFVSFPAMLGLSFIAPEFITALLTDKWSASADILRILCIGFAFIPINTVCLNLFLSQGHSKTYMWLNTAIYVLNIVVIIILYPYGVKAMAWGISVVNIVALVSSLVFIRKDLSYMLGEMLNDLLPFAGLTIIAILIAFFILKGVENIYVVLFGKIIIVGALYLLSMWGLKSVTFIECIRFFLKK